jgi:Tfp pilus assembly protein PilO
MLSNVTSKTKGQASVIETVALLIVIGLVAWFFVLPKQSQVNQYRAELQAEKDAYQKVDKDKQELLQLISKLKQSEQDLKLLDEALPLDARVTKIQLLLESMAAAAGMRVPTLNPTVSNAVVAGNKQMNNNIYDGQRSLQTINVDMTVSGGIDQFRNFLSLLETNGRIIDVVSVDLSNDEGGGSFRLKLKSYSYVP